MVIATMGRPELLRDTLASLAAQTAKPYRAVIVDASGTGATKALCSAFPEELRLDYQTAQARSAARQRNQGAFASDRETIGV
ncbi:glycosyltransferase family A protein [Termitidicoccus mucosus]|uniref:glycosyltransferase family 2 protein n=1 Tax=Termitidicoccus mucosus TaxID=1184151 RepID=UPI003183C725